MAQLFLLYDSITNSAFYSQVFTPIIQECNTNPSQSFFLISFEKDLLKSQKMIKRFKELPQNLTVILKERLPFWGNWTLNFSAKILANFMETTPIEKIVCRGVFAARIAELALEINYEQALLQNKIWLKTTPAKLTTDQVEVLIPGLASAEVLLGNDKENLFWKQLIKLKSMLFSMLTWSLESHVFSKDFCSKIPNLKTSFVMSSQALKEYICEEMSLPKDKATVLRDPNFDLEISINEKLETRQEIRSELNIDFFAPVYVYSGSLKSWQGFELTLAKFSEILTREKNAVLLVLTNDLIAAKNILEQSLPSESYRLRSLPPEKVLTHLLACDFGMLFREPNLVNWTARPIKALEYKQAGLLVMHNHTVEWVIKNC